MTRGAAKLRLEECVCGGDARWPKPTNLTPNIICFRDFIAKISIKSASEEEELKKRKGKGGPIPFYKNSKFFLLKSV